MLYCNGSPCQISLTQDKIFTTLGTERCNQGVILLLSQNVLLPHIQLWSSRLQWLWQDHAVALHPGSSEIGEWSGYYPGSSPRVQRTQHTWQGCWVHATGGMKHCRQLASSPGHFQILSRSRGEKSGEGLGSKLRHGPEMVDLVST